MQPSTNRLVTEAALSTALAAAAPIPDVRFAGTSNSAATLASTSFVVVPITSVGTNVGSGTWDAVNYTLTLPVTGLYLCVAKVRIADSSTARNVHLNIHTSNADDATGSWRQVGGVQRDTIQTTRLDTFTAGQALRAVLYSEGSTFPLTSSSLSIVLLRNT
jgi:hypothetical protein